MRIEETAECLCRDVDEVRSKIAELKRRLAKSGSGYTSIWSSGVCWQFATSHRSISDHSIPLFMFLGILSVPVAGMIEPVTVSGDAVELVQHGFVEAFADAIGLRALSLGARVVDVLDREIELVLVPLWVATVLAAAIGQHTQQLDISRRAGEIIRRSEEP
jgi:hypothetical protein